MVTFFIFGQLIRRVSPWIGLRCLSQNPCREDIQAGYAGEGPGGISGNPRCGSHGIPVTNPDRSNAPDALPLPGGASQLDAPIGVC